MLPIQLRLAVSLRDIFITPFGVYRKRIGRLKKQKSGPEVRHIFEHGRNFFP